MGPLPSRICIALPYRSGLTRLKPDHDPLFGVLQRADGRPEVGTRVHVMLVVDLSAQNGCALPVRWAALLHDLGKGTTPDTDLPRHPGHEARSVELAGQICARLKVPVDCRELAVLVARYHGDIHRARELAPATIVRLLENTDGLRRPDRFEQLLSACACDFHGRLGWRDVPYAAPAILRQALAAMRNVDAAAAARGCSERGQIPERIHEARVAAVKRAHSASGS